MYSRTQLATAVEKPDTDRMCMNSDIDTNCDLDARYRGHIATAAMSYKLVHHGHDQLVYGHHTVSPIL